MPGGGPPPAPAADHTGANVIQLSLAKLACVTIQLNGDPYELGGPVTVSDLLARLDIDARRVAVEYNLTVLKRATFDSTVVNDGDAIEIVNFVGGG